MSTVLILSGGGDLTDPWHPFGTTSQLVLEAIASPGRDVRISTSVLDGLAQLSADVDLVVVNAANAERPARGDAEAIAGLGAYLRGGGALLALHVSATAFPEIAEWESIIGARWVRGTTMHPDQDLAAVRVDTDAHPIVSGVHDFEVWDERYTHLRVAPDVRALAWHELDGVAHPLLWARDYAGGRVVYDALGHDAASFESREHRAILARSAEWLLG